MISGIMSLYLLPRLLNSLMTVDITCIYFYFVRISIATLSLMIRLIRLPTSVRRNFFIGTDSKRSETCVQSNLPSRSIQGIF